MKKYKVGLLSLGCDKNRIDSEIVLSNLNDEYEIISDEKEADIIIVNTCGFIEASKEESIEAILEMAEYKNKYSCKVLIATGCLTQRYGQDLLDSIEELDIVLGVNDYTKLKSLIESKIKGEKVNIQVNYSDKNINEGKRILTTGKTTAYIRISEGCDKECSYCVIPKIRGKYRSRTIESILEEGKDLVKSGVKELILVAQDSARYGVDLYKEKALHKLVKELSNIKALKWIRILYCYPEEVYDELIYEIAINDKVCKYLDIPIQHISDNVLSNMKRATKKENIVNSIKKMRERIPNLVLRTSIIVGFPGETEKDFNELLEFAKEAKLEKLGVFKYSREEDTKAYDMIEQISEEEKTYREEELMIVQQRVSKSINRGKIGKTYEVIVEEEDEEYYYGRSFEMAPEIDGEIFIEKTRILKKGEFVKVKITDSLEYDLIGVVSDELSQ